MKVEIKTHLHQEPIPHNQVHNVSHHLAADGSRFILASHFSLAFKMAHK